MSEKNYPAIPDPEGVERVYGELLARAPENKMAPRLDAVARAVEILGDVHRAAPGSHTNRPSLCDEQSCYFMSDTVFFYI